MIGYDIIKGNEGVYSKEDVLQKFNESNSPEDIREFVTRAKDRLYTTWATVDAIDNSKEKIPIDEAIEQVVTLMKRGGNVMDHHSNKQVGRTLGYKVFIHPKTRTPGIYLLNEIFNDNELDNKVWEETVSGKRTGSSIGGFNMESKFDYDSESDTAYKTLKGFRYLENSSVDTPCNPFALNDAISMVAKGNKNISESILMDAIKMYDTAKAKTVRGYESPEPGNLPEKKKDTLAQTYASCREDNPGEIKSHKEKCAKIAWAQTKKEDETDTEIDEGIAKEDLFDKKEIAMGLIVEEEHAKDLALRTKITIDHLLENKHYYMDGWNAGLFPELDNKFPWTTKGDQENVLNKSSKEESTTQNNNLEENKMSSEKTQSSEGSVTKSETAFDVAKMKAELKKELLAEMKKAEDKEMTSEEEDDEEEVEKEGSDPSTGSEKPESPEPTDANDKDVFKRLAKMESNILTVAKSVETIAKSIAPRPAAEIKNVGKSENTKETLFADAVAIAKGEKQMTPGAAENLYRKMLKAQVAKIRGL